MLDLALLYDSLSELSILSDALQNRNMTLTSADKRMRRCIAYIEVMGEKPGHKVLEAQTAVKDGKYGTVHLTDRPKNVSINRQQFLRSLDNNLTNRLFTTASFKGSVTAQKEADDKYVQLLKQLKVLKPKSWPRQMPLRFGEVKVMQLCQRFRLPRNRPFRPETFIQLHKSNPM